MKYIYFILLFTAYSLNIYSQSKEKFAVPELDNRTFIDNIKSQHKLGKSPVLIYQTSMDNTCLSTIIFAHIQPAATLRYWCIAHDGTIYEGDVNEKSLLVANKDYSATGVLVSEAGDLNLPLRISNCVVYENGKQRFYFEDEPEAMTYEPDQKREKPRREWAKIIHKVVDGISNSYCFSVD